MAALYLELVGMYEEEHPPESAGTRADRHFLMAGKIEDGELTKQDMQLITPVFAYGHIDAQQCLTVKKRFIWF